jgi:hypothetical protein
MHISRDMKCAITCATERRKVTQAERALLHAPKRSRVNEAEHHRTQARKHCSEEPRDSLHHVWEEPYVGQVPQEIDRPSRETLDSRWLVEDAIDFYPRDFRFNS